MGIAPFFIPQHRVDESPGFLQVFFFPTQPVSQGQIQDGDSHIRGAFFRVFHRQFHSPVTVGLFQKPLILTAADGMDLLPVRLQITDKNQFGQSVFLLVSGFGLWFVVPGFAARQKSQPIWAVFPAQDHPRQDEG